MRVRLPQYPIGRNTKETNQSNTYKKGRLLVWKEQQFQKWELLM